MRREPGQAAALVHYRFEEVEAKSAAAERSPGWLIKVTPSSKVVGELALSLVCSGVGIEDFAAGPGRYDIPDSVIGFLRGELGAPPGAGPNRSGSGRSPGVAPPSRRRR